MNKKTITKAVLKNMNQNVSKLSIHFWANLIPQEQP